MLSIVKGLGELRVGGVAELLENFFSLKCVRLRGLFSLNQGERRVIAGLTLTVVVVVFL